MVALSSSNTISDSQGPQHEPAKDVPMSTGSTETTTQKSSSSAISATKDDDILQDINEDQLDEFKQMLLQLGPYPDKVLINTLSMIAEDYSTHFPKSSSEIYNAIKDLLLSQSIKADCKLPLVYVIDSILKNAKGLFIKIMEDDIANWIQVVHTKLGKDENAKSKLRKVWKIWNEIHLFNEASWNNMGQCFKDEDLKIKSQKVALDVKLKAAGIERNANDGTIIVSKTLRKHMQSVLNDVQSGQVDVLEQVSLERLADINPDLLVEIKKAAEDLLEQNQQQSGIGVIDSSMSRGGRSSGSKARASAKNDTFMELCSSQIIERSDEWEKLDLNHMEDGNDVIKKLLSHVRSGTSPGTTEIPLSSTTDSTFTSTPASSSLPSNTTLLAAASTTASHLTTMLERLKTQDHNRGLVKFTAGSMKDLTGGIFHGSKVVDRNKFTNEGLKEKNETIIARLYDGGLPFVSSADGRRFGTQLELSKHLDDLFRKNQLEKSMERTDERGWYQSHNVWSGLSDKAGGKNGADYDDLYGGISGTNQFSDGRIDNNRTDSDPALSTVVADDSRDKCAICGINFSMKFNQDEGEWKYGNCREIEVSNVSDQEYEMMLVHVTCLRGLGSPAVLTSDQVLTTF